MTAYISLCNWSSYQHYKDRDPPWVKLHRNLLSSESWVLGSDASRVVQIASILLAPRYDNRIPYNFELLKAVGVLRCTEAEFHAAIEHLKLYKFLEIHGVPEGEKPAEQDASKALAKCSPETETETEAEKNPPVGPPTGGRKRTASKGTQCPDPFVLTRDMFAWARAETPGVDPKKETNRFVDHWRSVGKTKRDWQATWRNWMRKAQEDVDTGRRKADRQSAPPPASPEEAAWERLKDEARLEQFRMPLEGESLEDYRRALKQHQDTKARARLEQLGASTLLRT